MGKTNQQRQQTLRDKDKERGWQRIEFRLPAHLVTRVKAYVERLLRGERK